MTEGRFPPPWTVEETAACFIVKDSGLQALACAYSRMSRAGAQRPNGSRAMRRWISVYLRSDGNEGGVAPK